ncbi:YecA family protein [Enterobacteriaceae bacterium LUAb1]
MSIQNEVPDYRSLASILSLQGVGMTPAEMHGLISGLICGGSSNTRWLTLLQNVINEGEAFPPGLSRPLQQLHQQIVALLDDDDFSFQIWLPDDEKATVFDCIDALAGWVNHFLLGLGITQPALDNVTGEAGEAIDDLRTIAQLGYDEDEDEEELAQSLEEVVEYVRVAALLCHDTFTRSASLPAAENRKPTLH